MTGKPVDAEDVLKAAATFLDVESRHSDGSHIKSAYYSHYLRTLEQYKNNLSATERPPESAPRGITR